MELGEEWRGFVITTTRPGSAIGRSERATREKRRDGVNTSGPEEAEEGAGGTGRSQLEHCPDAMRRDKPGAGL